MVVMEVVAELAVGQVNDTVHLAARITHVLRAEACAETSVNDAIIVGPAGPSTAAADVGDASGHVEGQERYATETVRVASGPACEAKGLRI